MSEAPDMGRCYDFGISIDPSSEQAMVVAPEGGHCVCPSTGTTCNGRFAVCGEIVEQAGRISPSAPAWALVSEPPAIAAPDDSLTAAVDKSSAHVGDRILSDLLVNVDSLRAEVTELRERPVAAAVDDLADAVVMIREETPTEARAAARVDSLQHQVTALAGSLTELTRMVGSVVTHIENEEVIDLTEVSQPMHQLGRAVMQLRDIQKDTTAELRRSQTTITDRLDAMGSEYEELANRQSRDLLELRLRFTEMQAHIEERHLGDTSSDDLTRQLDRIQSDLARLDPGSTDMVSATQLADTINTLRDAGVDEISAAHLVDSLQSEMRGIRSEIQVVNDRVDGLAGTAAQAV